MPKITNSRRFNCWIQIWRIFKNAKENFKKCMKIGWSIKTNTNAIPEQDSMEIIGNVTPRYPYPTITVCLKIANNLNEISVLTIIKAEGGRHLLKSILELNQQFWICVCGIALFQKWLNYKLLPLRMAKAAATGRLIFPFSLLLTTTVI